MFHKVHDVRALTEMRLIVHFSEGVSKIYSMAKVLERFPQFRELLKNSSLFYSVHVDVGGYGISWNEDLDLSCDELWEHGITTHSPFDNLMAFADATTIWNLNESTLRKAVAHGKLIPGIDVRKFGKQWIVSTEAMKREYGEPASRVCATAQK